MKKSNALMLSYIGILLVTIFADRWSDWSGMDQVALAATMAGFFFALADYYGWKASYNKPMIEAQKEYLSSYKAYLNEVLNMANSDSTMVDKVAKLLEPYCNLHDGIGELLIENKKLAKKIDKTKSEANKGLEELPQKMNEVTEKENRIQRYSIIESVLATAGFLVFFIIVIFDKVSECFMPSGSITTVSAFGIIMLTYYAKDIFEAKAQKNLSEITSLVQGMKDTATEYKENYHDSKLLESAKKIVSEIDKYINDEEDVDDE